MSESRANYREATSRGRRFFELFEDHIRVQVRSINVNSVLNIPLSNLCPEPNRLFVRMFEFWVGLMLFVIGTIMTISMMAGDAMPVTLLSVIISSSCVVNGAAISAYCVRRVEFTQFVSHTGIAMLDVARSGPDRRRYDEFVAMLKDTIAACQAKKE